MKKVLAFLIILVSTIACDNQEDLPAETIGSLEPKSNGEIINHTYYSLAYSEIDEQAYWVYYHLTPEQINGNQARTDDFREDPWVNTGSASLDDYVGSGFDRGHLCPAADMKLNHTSMSESFYLSNMSPQNPSFNRGIWSKLESQVREWALAYDGLYVVTGGILKDNLGTIGPNEVAVPKSFYKILYSEKEACMIAFILSNEGSSESLEKFAVSVDSVESITGIDFFSGLPDLEEELIESEVNISNWVN